MGERLSGLSSGQRKLATYVASFCVETDEEFAGQGDADDLFGFASVPQPLVERAEVRVVAANHSTPVAATRTASATVLPLASPATAAANATTPRNDAITRQARITRGCGSR